MLIHEMTQDECRTALARVGFGRLACAHDDQPYVVPISFSYDGTHLYGFSTLGQKIEWMRSNPLVCLEIDDHTSHREWMSVVAGESVDHGGGRTTKTDTRAQAWLSLQRHAMWWQPAHVATEQGKQLVPVFYRIHIRQMAGRRAMPDPVEAAALAARLPTAEESWLGSLLHRWNRSSTFVVFEPRRAKTEALIKLPRTNQTDAVLRDSGLDFNYDKLRGRYRLRLGPEDIERSAHLLTELMKKAQRAGAK